MTRNHEELVEEVKDRFCKVLCGGYNYGEKRCDCYPRETWGTAQAQCSRLNDTVDFTIARMLSAFRDGKVEILCPECNEPIKVLKCEGCHLENVDGYIRH